MKKTFINILVLLVFAVKTYALDEIKKEEKVQAIIDAKQAIFEAKKHLFECSFQFDFLKSQDYAKTKKELAFNSLQLKKETALLRDEEQHTPAEVKNCLFVIEQPKKRLEVICNNLRGKIKQLEHEIPTYISLYKDVTIAQAQLKVAEADLENFIAQEELNDWYLILKHTQRAQKNVLIMQQQAQALVDNAKAAAQGNIQDNPHVKKADNDLAQTMIDALATEKSLNQAMQQYHNMLIAVKGTLYKPVIQAQKALNAAKKTLKRQQTDINNQACKASVQQVTEQLATDEKEYSNLANNPQTPLEQLGTEAALKRAKAKLASHQLPLAVSTCSRLFNAISTTHFWHTWIKPHYTSKHFTKDALDYNLGNEHATMLDKLTSFKKALTQQGLDFSASMASTIRPSLRLGTLALAVGSGIGFKMFGLSKKMVMIGGSSGFLTTMAAGLYLGYRHGIWSYGARRQHIIQTARKDNIIDYLATKGYEDVTGPTRLQALKKFGPRGLIEMCRIKDQLQIKAHGSCS